MFVLRQKCYRDAAKKRAGSPTQYLLNRSVDEMNVLLLLHRVHTSMDLCSLFKRILYKCSTDGSSKGKAEIAKANAFSLTWAFRAMTCAFVCHCNTGIHILLCPFHGAFQCFWRSCSSLYVFDLRPKARNRCVNGLWIGSEFIDFHQGNSISSRRHVDFPENNQQTENWYPIKDHLGVRDSVFALICARRVKDVTRQDLMQKWGTR